MSAVPQADPGSTGPQGRAGSPHIVRLQDATAQPWRNGGGVTRELLTWSAPEGLVHDGAARHGRDASAAGWDLRVSVADIAQDGPFSAFPGISRCFAVLEGAGVVLSLRGQDQVLDPASEALAFDGAEAPGCRLVSGPTRDLNLMVRRTAAAGELQRAHLEPGQAIRLSPAAVAVVVLRGEALTEGHRVHEFDALVVERPGAPVALVAATPTDLAIATVYCRTTAAL